MSGDKIRDILDEAEEVGPADLPPGKVEAFEIDLAWLPRNDTGNATRFIRRQGKNFIWVENAGWYGWDGARWDFAGGKRLSQLAAQGVAAAMKCEAQALEAKGPLENEKEKDFAERIAAAYKWAISAGNAAKLKPMIDQAAPHLTRRQDELDAAHFCFNAANGTLVLGAPDREGFVEIDFRDHRRRDLATRLSPVAFDSEATLHPLWTAFLDRFLPDKDVQQFLQRYFGYCLTGSIVEQCLILLHGEGSNGKSTLVGLLSWLLGDYAMSLPINSLLANDRKGGSEASPDLARLPGARMVRSSEPKQGATFDESLLKELTGGEPMTVRHLNEGFFEFAPTFKLVLSFNRRPIVRGTDDGIWRRLLLVPFEVRIDKDDPDRDVDFLAKLKKEGPAILNWLLDGYRLWRESGLKIPDVVRTATEQYRSESDPIGNFIDASCIITGALTDSCTSHDLVTAYNAFCKRNGLDAVSQTKFGKTLSERRGVTRFKSGTMRYLGIQLIDKSLLTDLVPAHPTPPPRGGRDGS